MAYQKKHPDENRKSWRKGIRQGFDSQGGVVCRECFKKKIQIDELKAEIVCLKAKIKGIEKASRKDVVNAHTPSSRIGYKKNSEQDLRQKKGGAKVGHKGIGRSAATQETADKVIGIEPQEQCCPDCGGELCRFDERKRTVIESMPLKAEKVLYKAKRFRCRKCKKVIEPKPETLPRSLYGNRLLTQSAVMHYVHGVPIGRVLSIVGPNVTEGGIIQAFHRLGGLFDKAIPLMVNEYRTSPIRHADETGWRTDGHSGYAWLFATKALSLLEFADTRASRIPKKIFGTEPLSGVLVVDRYGGYNKMPVALQYCYAHLLREVEKLETEFSDNREVVRFTSNFIPLLTQAMKLRGLGLEANEYYKKAREIKDQMKLCLDQKSSHLGISRIKQIFDAKKNRLYHWVENKDVPPDNNMAERELRPTVIARKASFGSQSDAGAKTRGVLMSVLLTAKKRLPEKIPIEDWLKATLDKLAKDPLLNIYDLLPRTTKD